MAQEKLLAQVRIGYKNLQDDVDKINQVLGKINQGKKDIEINVKLQGLEGERFRKIHRNITIMVQQFDRLNRLILNINKNSDGLNKLGNVGTRTGVGGGGTSGSGTQTDLGNIDDLQGSIIRQSQRTTGSGSTTSTLFQDDQGLTTNIISNEQGRILSRTQELTNANTQFERSLNEVMNSYRNLNTQQQNNLNNVRNTINALTNLSTRYDQNSSQFRRIMQERERMSRIERRLADEQARQPLDRMINNYRMLSIEQQQQPRRIQRIINEYDGLINRYRQEGREVTELIQQRNQYQRAFTRSINSARTEMERMENSVRTTGIGEFLGFGRPGVLGSGDRRAGIIDKITNSFIYSMSAMAIGQTTMGLNELVETNKNFELGLISLSRTMDNVTSASIERLGRVALDTASKYGIALNEIQDAQTELARAGVSNEEDLKQLTETVALGLNTTEIKNANEMVGYLISTIKQLNLDISESNTIIDEWNYLADKYAVHSNDFAEAISKSGAASKKLGLTIQDINSMTVVLGEATQASGREIGNAIKTLESHLLRPETVKKLESYGIAVKKNAKEFLDFKTIMQNVDNALGEFEENSLATDEILRSIGGTWRKNWIALLADSWNEIENINRRQDEAIGYSAKENEKVMNTYAKQVEQLKVSFSELAIVIGDAGLFDVLKGVVGFTNGVLNAFESLTPEMRNFLVTIGQTALAIKILSYSVQKVFNISLFQAIMKTSFGMKLFGSVTIETTRAQQYLQASMQSGIITGQDYQRILIGLNTNQRVRNLSVAAAERYERAYAMAMRDTAAASNKVRIASAIAIGGISIVIGILVSEINKWKETQKEADRQLEESISKHTENNKLLGEAIDYYKDNYDLVETDDNVKNELIETQKKLNELYGEEAEKLDLVNGKYGENVKEITKLKNKELKNLIADLEIEVEANKDKEFSMPTVSTFEKGINVLGSEKVVKFFEDSQKMGYEEYLKRLEDAQQVLRSGNEELIRQTFQIGESENYNATIISQTLAEVERRMNIAKPLMEKENYLMEAKRQLVRDNVLSTKILNKEEEKLYLSMIKAFDDVPIDKYQDKFKELITQVRKFDSDMKSGKQGNFMDLIIPDMGDLDLEGIISKVYPEMFNSLGEAVGNFAESIKDAKTAIQQMRDAQKELNETGTVTEENLIALLESNSDLIGSLTDRKKLQQEINKVVKQEAEVAQSAYANKLLNSKAFFNSTLQNNQTLYSNLAILYGDDLKNFKSLANAKSKIESTIIDIIGKNWENYYSSQTQALNHRISALKSMAQQYYMYGRGSEFQAELKQLETLRNTFRQLEDISTNIKTVNFTGGSFKIGDVGGGSGSSSATKNAELLKDRYIDINNLIAQQNTLLTINRNKQQYYEEMETGLKSRISLMEKETELLENQKSNYGKLASTLRSERSSLEKELASEGIKFVGVGDEKMITNAKSRIDRLINLVNKYRNSTSSSGEKAYENYKNQLEELQNNVERFNQIQQQELVKTVENWRNIDVEIKNVNESLSGLKIEQVLDGFVRATERYKRSLEGLNYEIQRLGGETELAKTSDLVMEKVRLITDEVENQRYALNNLLAETDSNVIASDAYKNQLDETQASLRQNILTLQELTKQQKENAKASISGLESRINTILDKGIELRKEALDEELNLYKEHVDKIIKERERQYEAEDFEKNLEKEYENRQELVNKINRLNLDSSLESYNKRQELEKKLQEFDEKIEEMKTQRQRDLIRQNLEDNVAAKESETSEAIKLIDEEFDIIKRRAIIHETIMSESFQSLQSKLPELFQTLGDGVSSFFETFESYEEHFGETLGDVSQKFADDILPQLENAFAVIDTYEERAAKMQIQALQLKYDNASDNDLRSQYRQQAKSIIDAHGFEYEDLRFADLTSGFYTTGDTPTQQGAQSALDIASITADPKFQEEKAKLKIRDLQIEYPSANTDRQKELEIQAKAIRDIWGWSYEDLKQWTPSYYDEKTLRSYAGGINKGLVTQTGKYLLHGTSNNPEWVFTNTQMFNLIKNLATTVPSTVNNFGNEDIIIHMPIYGNVDKSTIPMIKETGKEVVRELKKSLNKKGRYKLS